MKYSLWMTQELHPEDSCDHEVLISASFGDYFPAKPGEPSVPEVIIEEALYWSPSKASYLPYPFSSEEHERMVDEALYRMNMSYPMPMEGGSA